MKTKHVVMIIGAVALVFGGWLLYTRIRNVKTPPLDARAPQVRSNPISNTIKDILGVGVAATEAYSQAKGNLGFGDKKSMN